MKPKEKVDLEVQIKNKIMAEYYGGARMVHESSNCKFSFVESINGLWAASYKKDEKEKIQTFKNFLKQGRIVVSVNTTDNAIKEFILKNFEVYGYNKVPVGYNNGFQHHILIKNNDSGYANKMYLRPVEKTVKIKNPTMDQLEEVLTKTLKAKRRKTDIVKEVMANIRGK